MGSQAHQRKLDSALRAVRDHEFSPLPEDRPCGVLVVEADPDLQWRLARMLTVEGNRVVGTGSGNGALALVEQWPVDLVLVDEELPGMSGLEVAQRIREDYPKIPVVLMTADSDQEVRRLASLAGVLGCLPKPFHFEALTDLLESMAASTMAPDPAE